jgi:hypothetical protein
MDERKPGARDWQSRGRRFDPGQLHHSIFFVYLDFCGFFYCLVFSLS